MKRSVKVVASEAGDVIRLSKNDASNGAIRVQETSMEVNAGGFLQAKKASALIKGKVADLQALGLRDKQEIGGKIIHKESTEPAYDGHEPKINPETGAPVLSGGQPVYRQSFWTEDMSAASTLLATDKVTVKSDAIN